VRRVRKQGGLSSAKLTQQGAKVAFDLLFFSDMLVSPERRNSDMTSVYFPGMHLLCSPQQTEGSRGARQIE